MKDLIFPGNLQEIMNRVLAAERNSQAQLVEARARAEVEQIQAQSRAEGSRREAEAEAQARRVQDEAEAVAVKAKAAAESAAYEERVKAAAALEGHPALLRMAELKTLRELAKNANAWLYLGFDRQGLPRWSRSPCSRLSPGWNHPARAFLLDEGLSVKITSLSSEPILEIPFLNAGKGQGSFYVDRLPVLTARADSFPPGLDAIIATADLQGRERFEEAKGGPPRLLGEVVPLRLRDQILPSLGLRAEHTGIVLAGDFYTAPGLEKRGGSGDVTAVWQAFGQYFRWTVGISGNHDTFGATPHPASPLGRNLYYLDDARVAVDGLRIAGLGGIIGNPRRPHRRTDQEFAQCLENLLSAPTDILVLHDGPDVPENGLRGSLTIRRALERLRPSLVVRGHAHWRDALVELAGGAMVLNVDSRVVIIARRIDAG